MKRVFDRLCRRWGKKAVVLGAAGVVAITALGGSGYALFLGNSSSAGSSSSVNLQKGLVGWWKLDGNARDSSPYRNNGVLHGTTVATDRKAANGSALSFNGTSSDYVAVNNFNYGVMQADAMGASWTLSIWAKWGGMFTNEGVLMGRQGCNGGIYEYNSKYAFAIKGAGCWTGAQTIYGGPLDSNWHLLTAVYGAGAMSFYEDGVLQGTATLSDMNNYGTLFGIGSTGRSTYEFDGLLDDARVYTRAISPAEVQALYDSYNVQTNAASGEKGLVGWWKLDGNAKDASPYRNNGSINGTVAAATDRKGAANKAMGFDGSSYIDIPDSPVFDIGSSGFTYSAWVYATALNSTYNMITGHHLPYFSISTATHNLHLSLTAGGAQHSVYGGTALNTGQWYFVTGTYGQDGYERVYVNGQLDGSAGPFGSVANYSYDQYIGQWDSSGTYKFTGSIDDLRVYNRALSADEIKNLYNSYGSQINLNANPTNTQAGGNINQGLVGYWNFNGNAKDSTPYRNNGTLSGSPTPDPDRFGRAGGAYSFNGTNQYITVPSSAPLNAETVTVAAWIKTAQVPTVNGTIVEKWSGGSSYPYVMRVIDDGEAVFGVYDTVHNPALVSIVNVCDGAWHLITGTRTKGGTMKLYVDGNLKSTTSDTTVGDTTNTSALGIGARGNGGYPFNGVIDGVRVYNRALSATEVQALYQATN